MDWALLLGLALMAVLFLAAGGSSPADSGSASAAATNDEEHDGRGRSADTASEMPSRGWKDILLRVYDNISEHRVLALAAGMTFYGLLAIFPALAALVAIYGLFADPANITAHLDALSGFLPGGAMNVARDQLTRVASTGSQTLGWTFLIGLAISLWSANAGMKSLFDTLNVIYGEREKRGLIKLNVVSLLFTLAGVAFTLLAIGALVVLPIVLDFLGQSGSADLVLKGGRWPALVVVLTFALAVVYRYGPSRERPRWRWITWGSALAAILWLAASALFSWYTAHFGSYNKTYGSLGAVIGFMTWMWISAIVVLIGAELDAEMEHQTARDTTGSARPMGARGAQMADTMGPSKAA